MKGGAQNEPFQPPLTCCKPVSSLLKLTGGDDMFCNHCSLECYVSVFIKIYFPPETSAPLLLLLSYASSAHTFVMWDSGSGRKQSQGNKKLELQSKNSASCDILANAGSSPVRNSFLLCCRNSLPLQYDR